MSQIIQKRPIKIITYTCTYCNLKLKTRFKLEKCYQCNKIYLQKPKYIKNKNHISKYKINGIGKVF